MEKKNIRKDSSTAQFDIIRILWMVVALLGFRLGMADIKGAYLQSGPIRRTIYVRPSIEWQGPRGTFWKLKKLPYGIVEPGRQRAKVIEEWMLSERKLERVNGLTQLYVRRNATGSIVLIVAKVTDDFIIGGPEHCITQFLESLRPRF